MGCPHEEEIERLKDIIVDQAEELLDARAQVRKSLEIIEDLKKKLPENVKKEQEAEQAAISRMKAMGLPEEMIQSVLGRAREMGINLANIHIASSESISLDDLGFGGRSKVNPREVN